MIGRLLGSDFPKERWSTDLLTKINEVIDWIRRVEGNIPTISPDELKQYHVNVGNSEGLPAAVDTNAVGDIRADSSAGLTIKDGAIDAVTLFASGAEASASDRGVVSAGSQTFGGRKSAGNSKCYAYRNSALSIPHNTTTVLAFDAELFDTNGEHNQSNGRFTASRAGYYLVTAFAAIPSIGAGGQIQLTLRKNGSTVFASNSTIGHANDSTICVAGLVQLNGSSDYVDVTIYQHNGSAASKSLYTGNANNGFQIVEVV